MEKKVKEELDKLIIIGNESGMLRTSTVKQLLNDLNKKTEEDFEDAVQYVEEKNIGLNTDDSENKLFLDSSKIAIVPKTLSVESIVKKIRYEEINLDTEFQRKRSLWKNDVKSQLIESFMVQLPM